MTDQNLGILLVDLPAPKYWQYYYVSIYQFGTFDIETALDLDEVFEYGYKCTEAEALKIFPNFKWVSLNEKESG